MQLVLVQECQPIHTVLKPQKLSFSNTETLSHTHDVGICSFYLFNTLVKPKHLRSRKIPEANTDSHKSVNIDVAFIYET